MLVTIAQLRLLLIQPTEVLENRAPLLGRESRQLVPRRVPDFRTRTGRAGQQCRGNVDAVGSGGRTARPLFLLVRLLALGTAAGVEQLAIQPLLALDRAAVEPARFELAGELPGFLRQRTGGTGIAARLQPFELLGERALATGELAQALHHGVAARSHHGQQALRVAIHPLLLLRHAGELFQRLLESRTRLRAGNPLRGAHQRVRRRVECVERLLGERGGAGGIGIALLELLARQFHLILRVAEGGLELWRDERVTTGCRADLLFDRVCAFLDGGLPGARRGNRFGVGVLRVLFGPFRLAALQIFSVFGERRELTLERRALEQLFAALELPAQLLLHFGEPLQRLPGCLRIEPRQRLLQLAQPLLELRCEGALQQFLHFAQPILARAVIQAGRLGGTRDFLHRLRQLLDALRHRGLITRDLLGALRGLERHGTLLAAAVRPSGRAAVGIPVPFLGKIARPVAQLALGGGDRLRRTRHCLGGGPRLRPQLLHAGKPQRDLGTAAHMRRWGVVERLDVEPQRIARQEAAVLGVEPSLHDRAITNAGD